MKCIYARLTCGVCLLASFLSLSSVTVAGQYDVLYVPEIASSFPGGFVALTDQHGDRYYHTDDILTWLEPSSFSIAAIFDTGSSGILLGQLHADEMGIAKLTDSGGNPVMFTDEGIGGLEDFYVSQATGIRIAPTSLVTDEITSWLELAEFGNYTDYGQFYLQMASSGIPDIVGAPILGQKVMRCNLDDWRWIDLVHSPTSPVLAYTQLLDDVPDTFTDGISLKIQLEMHDYFEGQDPPVSVGRNPLINNVKVRTRDEATGGLIAETAGNSWLFDTGAQLTVISRPLADEIGIDWTQPGVDSVQVAGVGGNIDMEGYIIDELVVPAVTGDELVFHDVIVFVPLPREGEDPSEAWDLPGELAGIFGMNLLSGNLVIDGGIIDVFDENDIPLTDIDIASLGADDSLDLLDKLLDSYGAMDLEYLYIAPNFHEWYFDGSAGELTVVLVPLPCTFAIMASVVVIVLGRRRR